MRQRLNCEVLETRETPAIITWGGGVGNWSTANKWVGGVVPGVNDSAAIVANSRVTVDPVGGVTVSLIGFENDPTAELIINTPFTATNGGATNGGKITVNAPFTVGGTFEGSDGTLIGNGSHTFTINSLLIVENNSIMNVSNLLIVNNGTIRLSSGTISGANDTPPHKSTLTNNGTIRVPNAKFSSISMDVLNYNIVEVGVGSILITHNLSTSCGVIEVFSGGALRVGDFSASYSDIIVSSGTISTNEVDIAKAPKTMSCTYNLEGATLESQVNNNVRSPWIMSYDTVIVAGNNTITAKWVVQDDTVVTLATITTVINSLSSEWSSGACLNTLLDEVEGLIGGIDLSGSFSATANCTLNVIRTNPIQPGAVDQYWTFLNAVGGIQSFFVAPPAGLALRVLLGPPMIGDEGQVGLLAAVPPPPPVDPIESPPLPLLP